jgi:hypothetical protein
VKIELQQEITLRPELELQLQQTAETILDLNAQKSMIEAQLETEKSTLDKLQKEVGQEKFESGEFKFSLTSAGGGSLSQQILLAVGVTASQIAKAKDYAAKIPKKKYVKVTRRSDKEVTEND